MRGLLSGVRDYLAALGDAAVRGWNAFFFRPADPTPLGAIRVVVGLLLLWNLGVYGLDLRDFFGSRSWVDPEALRAMWRESGAWSWSFWLWVPDAALWPVWAACMVVLALFAVGLWSRVTAVLAWVIVVSTARRSPVSLYGFDQMISTWTLYLAATGASGQAVSLDRFLARWRQARGALARRREDRWLVPSGAPEPSVSANLALRLIQLHLVLIYATAGLTKLAGRPWWTGLAVWGTIAAPEFRLFDLTWLVEYPLLINALTHAAVALEIGYGVLVWVPTLRPLVVTLAVGMHVGIELTLGLGEFGMAMLAANLAFASGSWLRSLVAGTRRRQPAGRVLYDGACPRCRASMALLLAGDPDRVIEPIDLTAVDVTTIHPSLTRSDCLRAMHLVRADGRVDVGFDAMATLAGWIPWFWPLAWLRWVPGVAWLGRRVYNRMAASRPRDVPCTDEVCGLHPPAASPKNEATAGSRRAPR